eukprot:TRINITY_DN47834_c0_g1_i1.p1 TRINITY_DN47834_c0_g1~~TRINITY_DN47834_c0_g1_i1.p1  ORF type:complete len:281 (+),score=63.24 TRINITY_DN47834_c0_g1_i1:53-895(+)
MTASCPDWDRSTLTPGHIAVLFGVGDGDHRCAAEVLPQATVADLKAAVEKLTGLCAARQRIAFAGRPLEPDSKKLSLCGVGDECSVDVYLQEPPVWCAELKSPSVRLRRPEEADGGTGALLSQVPIGDWTRAWSVRVVRTGHRGGGFSVGVAAAGSGDIASGSFMNTGGPCYDERGAASALWVSSDGRVRSTIRRVWPPEWAASFPVLQVGDRLHFSLDDSRVLTIRHSDGTSVRLAKFSLPQSVQFHVAACWSDDCSVLRLESVPAGIGHHGHPVLPSM